MDSSTDGPKEIAQTIQPGDLEPAPTLLRRGDRQAFDLLYYRYAPKILGLLLRLTGGNRAEAEDLTQETFLASYAACARYAAHGRPVAWLCGIAFRRWRDKQRTAALPSLPLSEALPDKTAVESEVVRRTMLEQSLSQLEPQFREVLLLIAGQQLTYREAAEITGEPIGTVKWRFHEATRRMRILMQNEELASLAAPTMAIDGGNRASRSVDRAKEDRNENHDRRTGPSPIARPRNG